MTFGYSVNVCVHLRKREVGLQFSSHFAGTLGSRSQLPTYVRGSPSMLSETDLGVGNHYHKHWGEAQLQVFQQM